MKKNDCGGYKKFCLFHQDVLENKRENQGCSWLLRVLLECGIYICIYVSLISQYTSVLSPK